MTPAKAALKNYCCHADSLMKRSTIVFFPVCLNYVINFKYELDQLNTVSKTPCFGFSLFFHCCPSPNTSVELIHSKKLEFWCQNSESLAIFKHLFIYLFNQKDPIGSQKSIKLDPCPLLSSGCSSLGKSLVLSVPSIKMSRNPNYNVFLKDPKQK